MNRAETSDNPAIRDADINYDIIKGRCATSAEKFVSVYIANYQLRKTAKIRRIDDINVFLIK